MVLASASPRRRALLTQAGFSFTVLPAGGKPEDTFAFDTGPGNMVIDQLAERMTGGAKRYDANGETAAAGRVNETLAAWMMQDPYLKKAPPKTGRRSTRLLKRRIRTVKRRFAESEPIPLMIRKDQTEHFSVSDHHSKPKKHFVFSSSCIRSSSSSMPFTSAIL